MEKVRLNEIMKVINEPHHQTIGHRFKVHSSATHLVLYSNGLSVVTDTHVLSKQGRYLKFQLETGGTTY